MSCTECKKPKKNFPSSVIEINNGEKPILFHKVIFPASLGDDTTVPADSLEHQNVLLVYEANGHAYLYSSDGVPTFISMAAVDLEKIEEELAQHGIQIEELQDDMASVKENLTTLQTALADETENRQNTDTNLQDQIDTNKQSIETLNTTVVNHTEQINNLESNLQGVTNELQQDIANEVLARDEADQTLQSNIDAINSNLNQEVEKDTVFTSDMSTVSVEHTKVNLSNNDISNVTNPLPVASETQAGVMNAPTYQAIQNNAENVDAILNGAVALEGLSADITQEQLTDAWKEATGKTVLINRASVYDITNDKVWYYYENINQWKPLTASTESDVNVSVFTNATPGIIKGSENDGQVFAEADGTGSVVGWDGVKHDLENVVDLLDTNPIPKLYDAYSTNTDGANTAAFITSKLNSRYVVLGLDASANTVSGSDSIAIGNGAYANTPSSSNINGIAIGSYARVTGSYSVAIGASSTIGDYSSSVALGSATAVSRNYEVSIGRGSGTTPTRYLANVTAGERDTDAVNVSQLNALQSSVEETTDDIFAELETIDGNIAEKFGPSDIMTVEEFNAAWDAA